MTDDEDGPRSFREIVTVAVREQFHDDFIVDPKPLAEAIMRELRHDGLAIHLVRLCVRPGDPDLIGEFRTLADVLGVPEAASEPPDDA